jgi:SagB-type dehydrogenase family enzyme
MSIGKQFMRETQYKYLEPSAQSRGEPQPPLELPYDTTQRPIDLPAPGDLAIDDQVRLCDVISERQTSRRYADSPLSLEELTYLLWCTQGIKMDRPPAGMRRTVPSAGARHPFETFVLVNRVEGLEPGLYRYLASVHKLLRLPADETIADQIVEASLNQTQVSESAVTFIWVAVAERTTWRYSERGYRYMHLDAGHVCQNLYLSAWAIGCGVCAIAAFDDEKFNNVLALDGEDQFVIYVGTVGKRR